MSASVRGVPVKGASSIEQAVAHVDLRGGVAAVLRLDPGEGGGLVRAPLRRARPGRHGVELRRHVVAQRQVGELLDGAALKVGDRISVGNSAAGTL
jgi:hypothetical protein